MFSDYKIKPGVHIPVLKKEVLKYLDPKTNENFIDSTIGEGGHTLSILEKNGPEGKVLGIELDPELYHKLKENLKRWNLQKRIILVNDSYLNLKEIIRRENFKNVSGILFDLGYSSWQIERSGRGFTFLKDEPLIMRYDWKVAEISRLDNQAIFGEILTAEKIVNEWSEKEIEKILREYGEEKFAKRISREICNYRRKGPIKTTFQLVAIIKKATPSWYQRKRIHFATRTFQALRIAVNDELNNLKMVLPKAREVLSSGGRLVVISFHSLEDRIVKNFFREESSLGNLKVLTKKPITPLEREIKINPRSRSAKLRAAVKT